MAEDIKKSLSLKCRYLCVFNTVSIIRTMRVKFIVKQSDDLMLKGIKTNSEIKQFFVHGYVMDRYDVVIREYIQFDRISLGNYHSDLIPK